MNQVEQLRLALLKDPRRRDITLRLPTAKSERYTHLVLIGKETLQTPMGPLATLHYERLHATADRKSDLWFCALMGLPDGENSAYRGWRQG